MEKNAGRPTGLISAAGSFIDGVLGSAQNRLQLLSIEIQEEKLRLVHLFIWVAAAVFAGMMTVALLTVTVVSFFWDTARFAALGGATLFYAVGLGILWWQFRRYLARQPQPFAATLGELERDRACIRPTS